MLLAFLITGAVMCGFVWLIFGVPKQVSQSSSGKKIGVRIFWLVMMVGGSGVIGLYIGTMMAGINFEILALVLKLIDRKSEAHNWMRLLSQVITTAVGMYAGFLTWRRFFNPLQR